MGAILAILLPLIPGLIQGVQAAFAHVKALPPAAHPPAPPSPTAPAAPVVAPSIGQTKADVVLQQIRVMVQTLAAINAPLSDGTLPASVPMTDDTLSASIETIYQQLKASQNLTPPSPTGTLFLVQGNVQPLKVG